MRNNQGQDIYNIPQDVKPWEYFRGLKNKTNRSQASFDIPEDMPPWEYFKQLKDQNNISQYAGQSQRQENPDLNNASADQPQGSIGRTVLEKGLKGATFGFGDEISDALGASIASLLTDEKFANLYDEARKQSAERDVNQSNQNPMTSLASEIAGSLVSGAGLGATKAGANLAKAINTGSKLGRAGKAVSTSAAAGGIYGAGSAKEGERLAGAGEGALMGGVAGTILPAAKAVKQGVTNTVYPAIEDTTKQLAKRARDFGIPLSVVQVSPTRAKQTIQKVTQAMPFSGQAAFEDKQKEAFGRAALKTIGLKGDKLNAKAIKTFLTKSNRDYNDVFDNLKIGLNTDKVKLLDDYIEAVADTNEKSIVDVLERNVKNIKADLAGDEISGRKFNSIISKLKEKIAKSNAVGVKPVLSGLPDILNEIAADSMSLDKKAKLIAANKNWKRFKTISAATDKSVDGSIAPIKLYPAIVKNKYIKQQEIPIGQDDLVDLGKLGSNMFAKLGGSDTAMNQVYLGTGGAGAVASGAVGGTGALIDYLYTMGLTSGASRMVQNINRLQPYVNKILEKEGRAALSDTGLAQALVSGTLPSQVLNNAVYNNSPKEAKELKEALAEIKAMAEGVK